MCIASRLSCVRSHGPAVCLHFYFHLHESRQLQSRADATGSRVQQLAWQRLARSSSILGILPLFKLTISERQQIAHGGLSSICPGPDNCPLADTQQPMPTVLVTRFQMQRTLGVAYQPQPSPLLRGREVTLATRPPGSLNILADY